MAILAAVPAKGQRMMFGNQENYDDNWLHFGFYLALNNSWLKHTPSNRYNPYSNAPTDSIKGIHSNPATGYTVGFVINMQVAEFLDFRFLPGVSFYRRTMTFIGRNGVEHVQDLETPYIELPLLFKYKSRRRNNWRVYVVTGLKPAFHVGNKMKEKVGSQELRLNETDLTAEIGIGLDLFYPLVKFSPEIRLSKGLTDIKRPDSNAFSPLASRITSQTVTLFLYFE